METANEPESQKKRRKRNDINHCFDCVDHPIAWGTVCRYSVLWYTKQCREHLIDGYLDCFALTTVESLVILPQTFPVTLWLDSSVNLAFFVSDSLNIV